MTSLTNWLLRVFADEWPGGLPEDGDRWGPLLLENRDNSQVVDHDTSTDPTTLDGRYPSRDHDLYLGGVIGVALTDYPQDPAGLGGREYNVEPVLSVRIEAAPPRKDGTVDDAEDFEAMVLQAIEVIQNVDNGTLIAAPVANFHVAEPETQNPQMADWRDKYTWQFDVRASGYRTV